MPAIVTDTTPLNYLVLIQAADILPKLYGTVLIPTAVKDELTHPNTPDEVRAWIGKPPSWLQIVGLQRPIALSLLEFDAGEREAISLASEQRPGFLLIDERDGAAAARRLGLTVTGTLGVLDLAATQELLDLPTMFDRLRQTTFRLPLRLMAQILEQDAHRKEK